MSYVIGLDLGTSSIKGLVLNKEGEVILTETASYSMFNEKSGYSEQIPFDWYKATITVLRNLIKQMPSLRTSLEGISVAGQMHSLILLDKYDEVLRPAILWNDTRTTTEVQEIMSEFGENILNSTKNIAIEGFTLPKLLWVKKNEPLIWKNIASFLLPKDYLIYLLTGQKQMEYTDAAGTLMFNLNTNNWDHKISENWEIPSRIYPKLVRSTDLVGNLNRSLSADLGLKREVKVFSGGADNACSALGAGIVIENRGMVSIGTSGVCLAYEGTKIKNYKGELHYFNHVLPGTYYSMGVTLAAGSSLEWFKNNFSEEKTFNQLLINLSKVPIGSMGLIFTPYISGERTPYLDSKIRGSFIGLDTRHTKNELIRAVIEGITFSLKESLDIMTSIGKKNFTEIISVGGGAKNKTWLQIQADVFNIPVRTIQAEQGPGFGAAMIAMIGLGWYESAEACVENCITYSALIEPIPKNVYKYQKLFEVYKEVYKQTSTICETLSEFS